MPTALVQLVISTGIRDEITTESFAQDLRDVAEVGRFRARAVTNLETMGWTLLRRPEVIGEPDGFMDVVAYWRKDFDEGGHANARWEMREAGAFMDLNFSLLWGYTGSERTDGGTGPDHEWGTEGPSRTD